MGYKFTIEYKKGSSNRAADALSRREEAGSVEMEFDKSELTDTEGNAGIDSTLLAAAAHPVPQLLELLRRGTASSPEMREIKKDIKEGRALPHLSLVDGLVYYHRRIFFSSRSSARTTILTEYHSSPSAWHPGFERMLKRIAGGFF